MLDTSISSFCHKLKFSVPSAQLSCSKCLHQSKQIHKYLSTVHLYLDTLSHHSLGPAIVVEAVMAKGLSFDLQSVASPDKQ